MKKQAGAELCQAQSSAKLRAQKKDFGQTKIWSKKIFWQKNWIKKIKKDKKYLVKQIVGKKNCCSKKFWSIKALGQIQGQPGVRELGSA